MKPANIYLILLLLLPLAGIAQRVVTLDPEKDAIARRTAGGELQLVVPFQALAISIQEAVPQITNIHTIGIQKIGRSNYLVASGREREQPEINSSIAVLLVETSPGELQTDNLAISCTSSGDCRECSLPPLCTCNKGEGSCGQNSAFITALKKVTVTIFD
jgi:hypothetical protein